MDKIYNYEDIKNRLQESIEYYDTLVKLWESVEYPTKKDGTPFKVLSKNFENAYIGKYYPVEDWSNPYLTVYGRDDRGNFQEDHMSLVADKYNKSVPEHNPDRETRTTGWGYTNEIMTLDEIKQTIKERVEMFKDCKDKTEKALAISEKKFKEVQQKVLELKDIIYSEEVEAVDSGLEYSLREYVAGFNEYIR